MTISTTITPVFRWVNDEWGYKSPPLPTPQMDTNAFSSGTSNCIAVYKNGQFGVAFKDSTNYEGAVTPGAGYANPVFSYPTLTGTENWWPVGFHGWGRTAYSPNYGVVVSRVPGMAMDGHVRDMHMFLPTFVDDVQYLRWTQLGNFTGVDNITPGASVFPMYWGYDYGIKQDLVLYHNQLYTLTPPPTLNGYGTDPYYERVIRSRTLPTVGAQVFNGAPFTALGVTSFHGTNLIGCDERVQLPWRKEWWVWFNEAYASNYTSRSFGEGYLYWFSTSGDNAGGRVNIPANIRTILDASYGEMALASDPHNHRVIAALLDKTGTYAAGASVAGITRWPVRFFQISLSDHGGTWTEIDVRGSGSFQYYTGAANNPTLTTASYPTTQVWAQPWNTETGSIFSYRGGCRFFFWEPRYYYGFDKDGDLWTGGIGSPTTPTSSGGFVPKEIFIGTADTPRTLTIRTRYFDPALHIGGQSFNNQKHAAMSQRATAESGESHGRIYVHGGDKYGGTSDGSAIVSFLPEATGSTSQSTPNSTLRVELTQPVGHVSGGLPAGCYQLPTYLSEADADPATGGRLVQCGADENGFEYRSTDDSFWNAPGYENRPGNLQGPFFDGTNYFTFNGWGRNGYALQDQGASGLAEQAAAGGDSGRVWRFSPTQSAAANRRTWTTFKPVYVRDPLTDPTYTFDSGAGGSQNNAWPYGGSYARRWVYDSGADRFVRLCGDNTIAIYNPNDNTFCRYLAKLEYTGRTTRPAPDDYMAIGTTTQTGLWANDRFTIDPSTGKAYCLSIFTGDVWEIDTRAAAYQVVNDGKNVAHKPTRWVCGLPPNVEQNKAHMVWAKGALWISLNTRVDRARVFSWAPGELRVYEHPLPFNMTCTTVCMYKVGADERLCFVGNEISNAPGIGNKETYYTGEIT